MATNGALPASALRQLTCPGSLEKDAAASFTRMQAAAAKAGYTLKTDQAAEAYRTRASQEKIFLDRYQVQASGNGPFGDVRTYNGKRYVRVKGASAAVPGTSNHGWGTAIDIQRLGGFSGAAFKWVATHGPFYGWNNTEGRRLGEAWHWVYVKANDKSRTTTGAAKVAPKRISTVKLGSKNSTVKLWQQVLIFTGHLKKGQDDGSFGRVTDTATRAYQKKAKIAVDGVVGLGSWSSVVLGVKQGHKNIRVKVWQLIIGFTGTKVDSVFGPATVTQTKAVQNWLGVTPDAVVGKNTVAAYRKKA